MMKRRRRQFGNAMVEFAVASAILVPCMAGTFQFGYTFYTYNLLESSVSNAARYGAFRTYRAESNSDITLVKTAIKNIAVYGTPAPGQNAVPAVKGLTPANINVTFALGANQIPIALTVSVINYPVKSIFMNYTLNGKPKVTFPYLGRYAPSESED